VCGPDIPLRIDKDQLIGRGGSALVLRGEIMNSVSCYMNIYEIVVAEVVMLCSGSWLQ